MAGKASEAKFRMSDDTRTDAYFVYSHNNRCKPHFHQCVELIFVISGSLCASLDSQSFTVSENELLVINSYVIHHVHTPAESSALILVIPLSIVPQFKRQTARKQFQDTVVRPSEDMWQFIHFMAKNWSHWTEQVHFGCCQMLLSMLTDQNSLCDLKRRPGDDAIRAMLMYVMENHTKDISLGDLASHAGYSVSRVSHILKAYCGRSFVALLNDWRCHTALSLLRDSGMRVIDVAYASGFNSARTFYRAFQSCYGVTPLNHHMLLKHHSEPERSIVELAQPKQPDTP